MIIEIPKDRKVHELRTSYVWKSDEGIYFSVPKPDAPADQDNEEIKQDMDILREIFGNKKVCLIGVSDPKQKPVKKEQRDFISNEITSVVKAMGIITTSPVSRMMANLFFSFKPPTYPVKMFKDQAEAVDWIRQYL